MWYNDSMKGRENRNGHPSGAATRWSRFSLFSLDTSPLIRYNDSMNKRPQINVFPLLTIGYFFCGVLALGVIGIIVGEIFSQISKLMG
jgi:hypothetical protein